MYISIAVYFKHYEGKLLKAGNFPVDLKRFRENQLKEVMRVANNFIQQISSEMSGKITVEKVIYDGDKDITDLIKK